MPFEPGDGVHVAHFGKGVVREVRNGGRYLVEIKGTAMVVIESQLSEIDERKGRRTEKTAVVPAASDASSPVRGAPSTIDLHGMTVAEAESAIDAFLNDALLAGHEELRIIHGRSGGHLKAALHTRLRQLGPVRRFRIDPRNGGVTIVNL